MAPLVHSAGDVIFNQMLLTWVLPMIAERTGEPIAFAERTVAGDIGYDSPEWIEAYEDHRRAPYLRRHDRRLRGRRLPDDAAAAPPGPRGHDVQRIVAAAELRAGTPTVPFDLHVALPPAVDDTDRPRPNLAWSGVGIPATSVAGQGAVAALLEYASRPEVDRSIVASLQAYSPMAASNDAIEDEVAQEFLPMFDDAITPLDWLWEPEITAELDRGIQALLRGDTEPAAVGSAVQAVARELRSSGRSYVP